MFQIAVNLKYTLENKHTNNLIPHNIKYVGKLDLSTLQAQVWRAYFMALTGIVEYR